MGRNERLKAADKCASKYTNENEARIARAAFMLGCEFEAQGEIVKGVVLETEEEHWKLPEDLEEAVSEQICIAADKHIRRVVDAAGHPGWDWTAQDIAEAFRAGAEWQKKKDDELLTIAYMDGVADGKAKMMEEAEEYDLYYDGDFLAIDLNMAALGYSERDKVRIIVIKEEQK